MIWQLANVCKSKDDIYPYILYETCLLTSFSDSNAYSNVIDAYIQPACIYIIIAYPSTAFFIAATTYLYKNHDLELLVNYQTHFTRPSSF